MVKNNIIKYDFKNYKKSETAKRKKRARLLAILGCILILSSLVGSLIYYI